MGAIGAASQQDGAVDGKSVTCGFCDGSADNGVLNHLSCGGDEGKSARVVSPDQASGHIDLDGLNGGGFKVSGLKPSGVGAEDPLPIGRQDVHLAARRVPDDLPLFHQHKPCIVLRRGVDHSMDHHALAGVAHRYQILFDILRGVMSAAFGVSPRPLHNPLCIAFTGHPSPVKLNRFPIAVGERRAELDPRAGHGVLGDDSRTLVFQQPDPSRLPRAEAALHPGEVLVHTGA